MKKCSTNTNAGGWLLDKSMNCGDLVIGMALTTAALASVSVAYTLVVELMFLEFTVQGIMKALIVIGK